MKLVKDKEYLVPCWISDHYIIPIIPHLHSDIENGQECEHYHVDDRFEYISGDKGIGVSIPVRVYPSETIGYMDYVYMKAKKEVVETPTPTENILESKLNMNNLKMKLCPHKGYDLSNVDPDENGVIRCPLHGLCTKNNKLIPSHKLLFLKNKIDKIEEVIDQDILLMIDHNIKFEEHRLYKKFKRLKSKIDVLSEL